MIRAVCQLATATLALLCSSQALASAEVRGTSSEFTAPGGALERCIALEHMPGGVYRDSDLATEKSLCAIDFYGDEHALCPKVFSTSPGTLVYDIAGGRYAGDRKGFERNACDDAKIFNPAANGAPVAYKMSVNGRDTSATFANSVLIYYHFARYFDASADVPVAVFRSIDRQQHQRRVSAPGLERSGRKESLKMNHAAWELLYAAEEDPASYRPRTDLFTAAGLVYGVMLHLEGKRYGEEINGTRSSGWGDGQNRDFQQTAPFLALRSDKALSVAIAEGRRTAAADTVLAKAMGAGATDAQMVFWMSDLIDITLLDFIFSQQDRIGNIDYINYWYWREDGEVQRRRAQGKSPPSGLAEFQPQLLKRTELGDNDAGLRLSYTNYTKRTGMLESLRHYRASTYRKLLQLQADFEAQGPLHTYVRSTFGLSDREFAQVVKNTDQAADILAASCREGRLRFDVEALEFVASAAVEPRKLDCGNP